METDSQRCRGRTMHASVETRFGLAALCDLQLDDLDAAIRYWYGSGDEYLDALGVDRALLGTPEDTRARLRRAIRTGDPDQRTVAFSIAIDGQFAGYTLLNRYGPEVNYSHWHITDPRFRRGGVSTALYPHRIKMYFDLTPMQRLVHQTQPTNVGVNRMLDRYVPIAETRYVAKPDGVAAPGEFHLRYVSREDVPRFFAISAATR